MVEHPEYIISKNGENFNLLKWSNNTENHYKLITSNSDLLTFLQSEEFHNEMGGWKSEVEIMSVSRELPNKERDKIWQMLNWYIKKRYKLDNHYF